MAPRPALFFLPVFYAFRTPFQRVFDKSFNYPTNQTKEVLFWAFWLIGFLFLLFILCIFAFVFQIVFLNGFNNGSDILFIIFWKKIFRNDS